MHRTLFVCRAVLVASIVIYAPFAEADILKKIGKALENGAQETGQAIKKGAQSIEKGAKDAGKIIENGAQDAGEAVKKGAQDTGQAIEGGVQDAGRGLNQFGTDLGNGICNFFNLDEPPQGEASCKAGVGYEVEKGAYTYDTTKPEQRYYGHADSVAQTPEAEQLSNAANYLNESQIQSWEYEDNNVYGIERFLPTDTQLGEAWPNAEQEVGLPTSSGEVLVCCQHGGGGFLTPRADKGAIRFHAGTDYVTAVGETIQSPVTGWVDRIKTPGRRQLLGLLIVNERNYSASVYNIDPTAEIKAALLSKQKYRVEAGKTVIGVAQDIHPAYPAQVPQHIHVKLSDPNGNAVAPNGKVAIKKTPKVVQQ